MPPLYEDPIQGVALRIVGHGIGTEMYPANWSISDPIFLRHILVMVVVLNTSFHIILCCRQLKVCKRETKPPPEIEDVMSPEAFQVRLETWIGLRDYLL